MADLQRQSVTNYRFETIEDYRKIHPVFNAYNTNADQATRIYFSDFPTSVAVAGGSVSDSTVQPILARKYENNGSIYKHGSATRPVSVNDTVGKKVTVASASDGATFSGMTFSINNDSICIVAKVSTAITMTAVFTDSGSETLTFAITTSNYTAESNGFARYILDYSAGTDSGSFDPDDVVSVKVTGSAASTIDLYDIQIGTNKETFIGSHISLRFDCLDEASWTDTLETADKKCGLYTTGKTATGLTLDITLKVRDLNAKTQSTAKGEVLKRSTVDVYLIQNAASGGLTAKAISAGSLTISGLTTARISSVSIGGSILDRVESASLVDAASYHYNSATGAFTFSTVYNGEIPTIYYVTSQVATYFDRKNLKTGFVGLLDVVRKSATGKTTIYQFPEVELVNIEMSQEDSEVAHTITLTAIPFEEGDSRRFYRQIEL